MQNIAVEGRRVRISRVAVLAERTVRVTWGDGVSEIVDLAPLLVNSRSLVRVRTDDGLFRTVQVSEDGLGVFWEDGSSLAAREIAKLPNNRMEALELQSIMYDLHLSSEGLAYLLGLSRRAVIDYQAGAPMPKAVVLAVRYLHENAS